jgi:exo-1,4-beta-D-glucosaminidase
MYPSFTKAVLVTTFAAMLALPLAASPADHSPRLLLPGEGASIRTNTPTLAWEGGGDAVEVWVDGVRMERLAGGCTRYVPFPLSFGEHRWKVVVESGPDRLESPEAHFRVSDGPLERLPSGAVLLREKWAVQSSEVAGEDGARLSSPGVDTAVWAPTSVPATVLTALVRNGIYPNPYVGLNNTRIPDTHDGFNAAFDLIRYSHIPGKNPWRKPYWFRTTFRVPGAYEGKRIWLTFDEINYRAEVWLNGARLSDPSDMVGMARPFRFDVSGSVSRHGDNVLAVKILPLDFPGRPEAPPVTPLADPGRNMGADADISLNYTKWDTIGWDWQPEIRDRDIGITRDVFLSATDDVEISDLYVASKLDLPDTSRASILLACDVVNHGSTEETGTLRAVVSDESGVAARLERPIKVAAGASTRIEWTPESAPEFLVRAPRLWWPASMGEPHLYSVSVDFRGKLGSSAAASASLGIRKFETYLSPVTGTRIFKVNGRDLYGQGGNWVTDMMLTWTSSRFEQEIATARQSNLNFLRIWGPTGAPPEALYDAADRMGIMIQQDFLHDHWGTDENKPGYAPPADVFEKATTAVIKRFRNHPSLFLWCGGNEGPNPREDLIKGKLLPTYDPWGTRYYLTASLADGLQGGGPYHNLPARAYFDNPKIAGFNSEIGPSGVPEWDSLRLFLPQLPSSWAEGRFPLDGVWAYHDATDRPGEGENRKFSHLDDLIRSRFGAPVSTDMAGVRDYAEKAQLLNFETYRSAVEALNQHLWEKSTGFAIWKFNSSWPSVLWQVTDWYQRLNAGTYSLRHALEPVHIQMNLDDNTVSVINRTDRDLSGVVVSSELFDVGMHSLWKRQETIDARMERASTTSWSVPVRQGLTFLRLRLLGENGSLSENFYWLEPNDHFAGLSSLGQARVSVKVHRARKGAPVRITVSNNGPTPAILLHLKLVDAGSGIESLPSYWTDNYLNLLPGERREVSVSPEPDGMPSHPAVEVSGLNAPEQTLDFRIH